MAQNGRVGEGSSESDDRGSDGSETDTTPEEAQKGENGTMKTTHSHTGEVRAPHTQQYGTEARHDREPASRLASLKRAVVISLIFE